MAGAFTGRDIVNEESNMTTYIIVCRDPDKKLKNLIEYIGKNGNTGHSFDIIVDPDGDSDQKQTFGWDGDGADFIKSIKEK